MTGNNPLSAFRSEHRIKKRVPGTPPRVFKADPFRTRQCLHIHAPHHTGHAEPFRETPRGFRLFPAFRAKLMIEMCQHEGYAEATQDYSQRRRIRPPRKSHDDMARRCTAPLFQKTPDSHTQPSPGRRQVLHPARESIFLFCHRRFICHVTPRQQLKAIPYRATYGFTDFRFAPKPTHLTQGALILYFGSA